MNDKRKTSQAETERLTVRLNIKVSSKSRRSGINGWIGDTLKLRVTAAPERGKANQAMRALLAEVLGIAKQRIRLVSGAGSTRKLVEIDGLDMTEVRRRLMKANAGA